MTEIKTEKEGSVTLEDNVDLKTLSNEDLITMIKKEREDRSKDRKKIRNELYARYNKDKLKEVAVLKNTEVICKCHDKVRGSSMVKHLKSKKHASNMFHVERLEQYKLEHNTLVVENPPEHVVKMVKDDLEKNFKYATLLPGTGRK